MVGTHIAEYAQLALVCIYRSGGQRCRRAGKGNHLLDGQAQFESMQWVTDADLPLDLRVRQGRHDGAALHISAARCHVPSRHAHPKLEKGSTGQTVM